MKKSILILTDLSKNALHAAELASLLAGKLKSDLVILNCDEMISAVALYPVTPVVFEPPAWQEDRSAKAALVSDHLKRQYIQAFPRKPQPVVKTIIRQGDLWTNVTAVLKEYPIDMIVMGAGCGSATEHLLFGSDTKNIADHSPVPVLIVSPTMSSKAPVKITFGTDFQRQDIHALQYLAQFQKKLGNQLDIVHISQYKQVKEEPYSPTLHFIEEICAKNPSSISFNEVHGKDVVSRLHNYCKGNNSDILALSHEHHSFLFRLFNKGVVDKSLFVPGISLLIIPELKAGVKSNANAGKVFSGTIF